mmetsp:Transcript_22134/g.33222  ORF Transcript_22134/g.33222 Transcript_22134/m.33222 type:complete len:94 (-) Transcript_22134:441-722(-)
MDYTHWSTSSSHPAFDKLCFSFFVLFISTIYSMYSEKIMAMLLYHTVIPSSHKHCCEVELVVQVELSPSHPFWLKGVVALRVSVQDNPIHPPS